MESNKLLMERMYTVVWCVLQLILTVLLVSMILPNNLELYAPHVTLVIHQTTTGCIQLAFAKLAEAVV